MKSKGRAALNESGRISCGCFLMTWQWTLSPRIAGKALHGQNDNELLKSAKTDTLSYTVSHSSFWMKREHGHKQVVKPSTCIEPGWRNWQTQRTQNPPTFGSWGFDSPSRHHLKPIEYAATWARSPHAMNLCSRRSGLCTNIYTSERLVYPTENIKFTYKML